MSIKENVFEVRKRIAAAAQRAHRDPSEIQLVAVSKIHPPQAIRQAYLAGQRVFGENYAQELITKDQDLSDLDDLRWHFIGHLQRNKVKGIIDRVDLLETVDSRRLLGEVEKRARKAGIEAKILIQVKIGGEATKSGCAPEELPDLLEIAGASSWVLVRGLMVIPPFELDSDETRPYFRKLRQLRDRQGGPSVLPELSMGMSHDFEVAIEEGSTLVRVGTAIFGPRPRR